MTSSNSLQAKKAFYTDFVYKYLVSLTRAEDVSLTFYGMSSQNQKDTEQFLVRIAEDIANILIEEWAKTTKNGSRRLTETQKEDLVKKALTLSEEKLNEKRGNK